MKVFVFLFCAVLFSVSLFAGGVSSPKHFTFVVMADPQFGMFSENRNFRKETELFERAVEIVNLLEPEFVVVCGDLVNRPGDDAQAAEVLRIARCIKKDIPLHWVAGNHDVENAPTPESLAWYRGKFGRDWYLFRHEGWRFVVLDSSIMVAPEKVRQDYDRQWKWLREELGKKKAPTIVFQHYPLFLKEPGEPDQAESGEPGRDTTIPTLPLTAVER